MRTQTPLEKAGGSDSEYYCGSPPGFGNLIVSFHLSHPYNEEGLLGFELGPIWGSVWDYDAAQRRRPDVPEGVG